MRNDKHMSDKKEKLITYLERFIGLPYVYGGSGPDGYDCSGLLVEGLRSVGLIPFNMDLSATGLYMRYLNPEYGKKLKSAERGAFVFFAGKTNGKMGHVALCLDSETMLEAGGGDSRTITVEKAIERKTSAFVRQRPIAMRTDCCAYLMPLY